MTLKHASADVPDNSPGCVDDIVTVSLAVIRNPGPQLFHGTIVQLEKPFVGVWRQVMSQSKIIMSIIVPAHAVAVDIGLEAGILDHGVKVRNTRDFRRVKSPLPPEFISPPARSHL